MYSHFVPTLPLHDFRSLSLALRLCLPCSSPSVPSIVWPATYTTPTCLLVRLHLAHLVVVCSSSARWASEVRVDTRKEGRSSEHIFHRSHQPLQSRKDAREVRIAARRAGSEPQKGATGCAARRVSPSSSSLNAIRSTPTKKASSNMCRILGGLGVLGTVTTTKVADRRTRFVHLCVLMFLCVRVPVVSQRCFRKKRNAM